MHTERAIHKKQQGEGGDAETPSCIWGGDGGGDVSPGPRSLLRLHLALDPEVRLAEALRNGNGGCPGELLLNERVVAVAPPHTLGAGDVSDGKVLALEAHRNPRKLVHAHLPTTTRWLV